MNRKIEILKLLFLISGLAVEWWEYRYTRFAPPAFFIGLAVLAWALIHQAYHFSSKKDGSSHFQ